MDEVRINDLARAIAGDELLEYVLPAPRHIAAAVRVMEFLRGRGVEIGLPADETVVSLDQRGYNPHLVIKLERNPWIRDS